MLIPNKYRSKKGAALGFPLSRFLAFSRVLSEPNRERRMGIRASHPAKWLPILIGPTILVCGIGATASAAQPQNTESAIHVSGSGGETYVLVSGLMGGVTGFHRLQSVLVDRGHRVIIIDPYRLSEDSADLSFTAMARRVDRVLARNHVSSATVVGHSHGGGVALRLAALNPDRVEALYLLDVGALPSQKTVVFSASLRLVPVIARLPGGRAFIRTRVVRGLRESSGRTDWLDSKTRDAYSEPFIAGIDRVVRLALRLARTKETTPLAAIVSSLRAPTTVILGAAPHIGGPVPGEFDALEPLGDRFRVERIRGAGHFVHEEVPELIATLLSPRSRQAAASSLQPGTR